MHTKITFNVGIFFLVVGILLVILSAVFEIFVFAETNIVGYSALIFGVLLVAVSSLLAD